VLDWLHEILQTLRRNRLRTFLTAGGIFWGAFMMVVMLGFGRGLENGAEEDIRFFTIKNLSFIGQRTSKPFEGHQSRRRIELTTDDMEAVGQVPGVRAAIGRQWLWTMRPGYHVTRGERTVDSVVYGDLPEIRLTESSEIVKGRFINPLDLEQDRKVAVVGPGVVSALFPGEDPIGKTLEVAGVPFQVVGVLDASGAGTYKDMANRRVFLPRSTVVRAFGAGVNKLSSLPVLVTDERPSEDVENDIRALLKARHHIAPDDDAALGSFNRERQFRKLERLFFGIRALSWIVGALTLIAGAVGVSNIMMITVAERTREFGIRKALGATPASVLGQVVAEATLLTALAGYVGLVLGVALLEIVARIMAVAPAVGRGPRFFTAPALDLSSALAAIGALTLAGVFSGLAPARSALAVPPAIALAHE
jgi:putative ABC transport system permease protein